jgi:CheY-like chemotaxis protein
MTTILVLEDEYAIAEMVQDVLEDEGYTVIRAGNGHEGLSCLAENTIQLVLSDVMMPVMDGYAFCHAMQANPAYRSIPIIMMSAVAEDALNNIQVPCNYMAFLQKPFALNELLGLIERFTTAVH